MSAQKHNGTDATEVEWQFEVADLDAVERWLRSQPKSAALAFELAKDAVQRDVYLDTETWDVYRARFALRTRLSAGRTEATLKALSASANGPKSRREISQGVAEATSLASGEGPVAERLRLLTGDRELRTIFEVETHRRAFRALEDGLAIAEIALDDARVETGGRVLGTLKRVEVECLGETSGSPLLRSFIDALSEAVDLQPAAASKFETGLALAGLSPQGTDAAAGHISPEATASEFALSILRRFLGEMVSHEPGTRLGEDPEELHDMRVALRRFRAALSMFRDVVSPDFAAMKEDLRWLGRALGEVRDLDVQMGTLAERRSEAPWDERNALGELLGVLAETRVDARLRLLATLESDRYRALLSGLHAAIDSDWRVSEGDTPVLEFVAPILKKRYRRFRADASGLEPDTDPAEYHAVRILGKRLRYSVEFTHAFYGKSAERMREGMADVQELLGDHQDAHVVIDWLRGLVRDRGHALTPQTLFYMGELSAGHRAYMQELRSQWPHAFHRVENRWRRLRKTIDRAGRDDAIEDEPEADELEGPPELDTDRSSWPRGWFALIRRRRHRVEAD